MTPDEMLELANAPLYGDLADLAERLQVALLEAAGEIDRLKAQLGEEVEIYATSWKELAAERDALRTQKDGAYSERDRLVSALSKLFPASLERHQPEDDDWEDDWRWIVFIELPAGQASWHIHDSELPLFGHLKRNQGRLWDGHSTNEKYRRLAALRQAGGE